MYIGLHVKYPLFLSDFNANLTFWTDFRKNNQISNFMEIRLVEQSSFMLTETGAEKRKDRETDRHERS
jgi:hypothetical protein